MKHYYCALISEAKLIGLSSDIYHLHMPDTMPGTGDKKVHKAWPRPSALKIW